MHLIDRYIDSVRRNLPRAQRDDIARELREILQTQIEEAEASNQRPLKDEEILGLLKAYGHPHEVAGRYGAHQYLIGPSVFPSYVHSVKITLWFLVPLSVFMVLLTAATAGKDLMENVLGTIWTMTGITLLNLAVMTLFYARISRTKPADKMEDWHPDYDWEELLALENKIRPAPVGPVRRGDAMGSMFGLLLLLAWWLGANAVLWQWFGWDPLPFEWTPVWSSVSYAAVPLILACIGKEIMGLIRPRWTKRYVGVGILLDVLTLVVLSRLLQAGTYVVPKGDAPLTFVSGFVNTGIFVLLLMVTVVCAIGVIFGIGKFLANSASWDRATV